MKYLIKDDARRKLLSGAEQVASVVAPTLGPKGHMVVLGGDVPIVTNDGATIAGHLKIEDPFESLGAELVKGVARNVASIVGDGTTTATILTTDLFRRGLDSNRHSVDVTRELAKAAVEVSDEITASARKVEKEELTNIGNRACRDKRLGSNIAELIWEAGEDSHIFIQRGNEIGKEVIQGSVIPAKSLVDQAYFPLPTEPLLNVPVLCFNHHFTDYNRIIPIVEELMALGNKEMLVIAEGFDGEALRSVIANQSRGTFITYVMKVEEIKETAQLFGAHLFEPHESGNPSQEDIGGAEKVLLSDNKIVVVNPVGDVEKIIRATLNDKNLPPEMIKRRVAQLSGHIGFLTLQAVSETEMEDKKLRADDGIRACQAALRGGVVEGGGVSYVKAIKNCTSPIMAETLKVIKKTIDDNAGYEVETNDVVDPALILTTALIHSTTAACQLINSEAVLL